MTSLGMECVIESFISVAVAADVAADGDFVVVMVVFIVVGGLVVSPVGLPNNIAKLSVFRPPPAAAAAAVPNCGVSNAGTLTDEGGGLGGCG